MIVFFDYWLVAVFNDSYASTNAVVICLLSKNVDEIVDFLFGSFFSDGN